MINKNLNTPLPLAKPSSRGKVDKPNHPFTGHFSRINKQHYASFYSMNDSIDSNSKSKEADSSYTDLLYSSPLNKPKSFPMSFKNNFFNQRTLSLSQFKKTKRLKKDEDSYPLQWAEPLYRSEANSTYGKAALRIQYLDYLIVAFAFLSILAAIVDTELYISSTMDYLSQVSAQAGANSKYEDIVIEDYLLLRDRQLKLKENVARGLNGLFSILLMALIIAQYHCRVLLLKKEKKLSQYEGIIASGLVPTMLLQSLTGAVFFPPGVHIIFQFSEGDSSSILSLNCIFNAVSLVKVFFVMKIINYLHKWNKNVSKAICKSYKVKPGVKFSIKCELNHRPLLTISLSFIIQLLMLSSVLRSYEYGSVNKKTGLMNTKGVNDLRSIYNTIWLLATTITAIGFGELTPRTITGRFIIVLTSIFGVLLMCLLIVSISKFTEFSLEEKRAYLKLHKLNGKSNKEHKAANVIALILKMKRAFRMRRIWNENKANEIFCLCALLITCIKKMRNDYVVSHCFAKPLNDTLQGMKDKATHCIDSFNESMEAVNGIENDIYAIEENEMKILEGINCIAKMQSEIKAFLFNQVNYLFVLRKRKRLKKKKTSNKVKEFKSSPNIQRMNAKSKVLHSPKGKVNTNDGIIKNSSLIELYQCIESS